MVKKNKNDKNDLTKVEYNIKPDIILFKQNKMLPTLKFLPSKIFPNICSLPNVKPIIQLSKYENRPALSFLQSPSHDFQNKNQQQWKVYNPTYNKSYKMQHPNKISQNELDLQKNYISSSIKQSYKSRRLTNKNQIKSLTFPNTINSSDSSKYYSQRKVINYYKESFPNSTLELYTDEQQNKKAHKKSSDKAQSSTKKNTLLNKNKNTLHKSKMSLPMTSNIYYQQDKERTNINYIKSVISNLNHIENKNLPKTAELMFLEMKTNNKKDLLISPMYQSFLCNFITPDLRTNDNRKIDKVKNRLYNSYSEHMMKIVNYENETQLLQMYYPKVCNLCCSMEDKKGIKRSMSVIQYNRSTQYISDIKTSHSDLHIRQNKSNNVKNNSYKVRYSLENINRTSSIPEKNASLMRACKVDENKRYIKADYDCKIKYSWQIIGTSSQTSKVLLDNILEENQSQFSNNKCEIKYSWQIIGTETQVALENNNDADYWSGVIFSPNIHRYENTVVVVDENNKKTYNYNGLCEKQACRKKCLILNNQYTQTLAEKNIQTDVIDSKAKYSWENLILQHL